MSRQHDFLEPNNDKGYAMQAIKLDKLLSGFSQAAAPHEVNYFSQFNIYNNFILPCDHHYKERDIETTTVTLEIYSARFIDTMAGTSIEGQHLTGKKLVLLGVLYIKIIFKDCSHQKEVHLLEKKLPFSTYIIVPSEVCEDQPINLRYFIEDITTTIIIKYKLFTSVTLLLQYVDEY